MRSFRMINSNAFWKFTEFHPCKQFAFHFCSLHVASLLFVYHTLSSSCWVVVLAEFNSIPTVSDRPDDEGFDLEPIAGTHDFLSNITRDISDKPWDDGRKENRITRSLRSAKCERVQNSTCFGAKIAWKFTSIQLSNEESQEQSLRKLYQLEASRYVPRCWAVIQPFLCAVFMPKCIRSKNQEYVYLPSYEMCHVTYEPCHILYESDFFPRNLQCNRQIFPCQNCTNAVREMKFNATGQCMLPLVPTESSINQYPGKFGKTSLLESKMQSIESQFFALFNYRYWRMRLAM